MGEKSGAALSAEELETHWKKLAANDAEAAFRALQLLAADPPRSVPYLRARLHPVAPADEKRLRQWIADLDSELFAVRERATSELEKLGAGALVNTKAVTGVSLRRDRRGNPSGPEPRRSEHACN
jgi:hypothetical protein